MSVKAELKQKLNEVLMTGQLAAKWCPRKKEKAIQLRNAWNMTPKQYRKYLVVMTEVTETLMCAKNWDEIDFSKVPSLAASRYNSAFYRNCKESYIEYVDKLTSGDKSVKVNTSAVFPHDVIKPIISNYYSFNELSDTQINFIVEQWNALPNFIGDKNIFPMIDTSGSMCEDIGNSLKAIDIAISLGLYCADKNTGNFKDSYLTFSQSPEVNVIEGNIIEKVSSVINNNNWGMNTDLEKAFEKMLFIAIEGKVQPKDMPEILIIFSDMQFDHCVNVNNSAIEMIKKQYALNGYEIPKVIFWNLCDKHNVPVKYDESGVALVSGFSPAILKSILTGDFEQFTPENIMLEVIMNERYDY